MEQISALKHSDNTSRTILECSFTYISILLTPYNPYTQQTLSFGSLNMKIFTCYDRCNGHKNHSKSWE